MKAYFRNSWGAFEAAYDMKENLIQLKKINSSNRVWIKHDLASLLENFYNQQKYKLPNIKLIGTDFQKKVWNAIATIPVGSTKTYKQIAELIKHPKAMRAVGTACKKNPIPFIIPCHRVISSDGSIGNYYYGKGLKATLLKREAKIGR